MNENPVLAEAYQLENETECGQRAFVITYDQDLRGILSYALESYDFTAAFCENWDAAFLSANIRDFDYLIVDFDFAGPHTDGPESIAKLRRQFPQAIIIGLSRKEQGMEFLHAGANDFFRIPFVPYLFVMALDGRDISSQQ